MWKLAVDLGTRSTKAARALDGLGEPLALAGRPEMPSAVYRSDDGRLIGGWEAIDRGALHPNRLEETPRRWLANGSTMVMGGTVVSVSDALAAVLHTLVTDVARTLTDAPDTVVLTHPAGWSTSRTDLLAEGAARAGLVGVQLVSEPVAAVIGALGSLDVGRAVGVLDLGAGTLGCAVVGAGPSGPVLLGPPGGHERMGGDVFDERLSHLVLRRLAAVEPKLATSLSQGEAVQWQRGRIALRTQVRRAREQLSYQSSSQVAIPLMGRGVPVEREELDSLIGSDVVRCAQALEETVHAAGLRMEQLDRILLVGGASRTPLVHMTMLARFGELVVADQDPTRLVALGAVRLDDGVFAGAPMASTSEKFRSARQGPLVSAAGGTAAGLVHPGDDATNAPDPVVEDLSDTARSSLARRWAPESPSTPLASPVVPPSASSPPRDRVGDGGAASGSGQFSQRFVVLLVVALLVAMASGAVLAWALWGGSNGNDQTAGGLLGSLAPGEPSTERRVGEPDVDIESPTDSPTDSPSEAPPEVPSEAQGYPLEVERNYFEACNSTGGEPPFCRCVWEGISEQIPFDEFLSIEQQLAEEVPIEDTPIGEIVERCRARSSELDI